MVGDTLILAPVTAAIQSLRFRSLAKVFDYQVHIAPDFMVIDVDHNVRLCHSFASLAGFIHLAPCIPQRPTCDANSKTLRHSPDGGPKICRHGAWREGFGYGFRDALRLA